MSKGLEELKKLKDRADHDEYLFREDTNKEEAIKFLDENNSYVSLIEKELKALEIIKNIGILRPYETCGGQCWLETMSDATKITKDNYELLKEMLL